MKITRRAAMALLSCCLPSAARAQDDVLKVANWLVGSFDSRAQAQAEGGAGSGHRHESAFLTGRPVQDPVVFGDALYVYVEYRVDGESRPHRQRVYRLKKSGRRVRVEFFAIDPQLRIPLASEPQMLSQLSPGDLTKERGCDILLEAQADAYVGATDPRSCPSDWKGSSYATTALRITKDVIVILERGYDAKGTQTFGPTDGRGYEFRRVAPDSTINSISRSE
jgi:CpeT protein